MKIPFDHGFKDTDIDIKGINGFMKCLNSVYNHIAEVTEFNPAKRMIDAVDILDKIAATSDELSILLDKEKTRLTAEHNTPLN